MGQVIGTITDPLGVTEPIYPITVKEPDTQIEIVIASASNSSGNTLYTMNGETFRANYNEPLLRSAQAGNFTFEDEPKTNVYNFGTNKTIRIILKNTVPFAHPIHVHGQNMYVLDEGVGSWDNETIIRSTNPQRRDTQILQPNGYLVLQLESDNPGVWPLHCHFTWHVSQGLYINVVQRPDEIANLTQTPEIMAQSCNCKSTLESILKKDV